MGRAKPRIYKREKCCAVQLCYNSSVKTPGKLFVTVPPKEDPRRRSWITAIRRPDLSDNTRVYICEDHFNLKDDIENYVKFKFYGGRIFLKQEVVPHKFPWQTSERKRRHQIEFYQHAAAKRVQKQLLQQLLEANVSATASEPISEPLRIEFSNEAGSIDTHDIKVEFSENQAAMDMRDIEIEFCDEKDGIDTQDIKVEFNDKEKKIEPQDVKVEFNGKDNIDIQDIKVEISEFKGDGQIQTNVCSKFLSPGGQCRLVNESKGISIACTPVNVAICEVPVMPSAATSSSFIPTPSFTALNYEANETRNSSTGINSEAKGDHLKGSTSEYTAHLLKVKHRPDRYLIITLLSKKVPCTAKDIRTDATSDQLGDNFG